MNQRGDFISQKSHRALGFDFSNNLVLTEKGAAQHNGILPNSAAPGLIHSVPKFLDEKIVDGDEVNHQCWLEESEQWLENVD